MSFGTICQEIFVQLFNLCSFPVPKRDTFNFNLGAVEVTGQLCRAAIPFIFISELHGYHIRRGSLADFVRLDFNDSLRWLLKRRHSTKDDHEILRHFVEDLFQYEYLLLVRKDD
jgi:hypothetical protein